MIPVRFLKIKVDYKSYNRIIRVIVRTDAGTNNGGNADLIIPKIYLKKMFEPNEFIRITCENCYADIKIHHWRLIKENIIIHFGELIDYNKFVIIKKK